MHVQPWHLPRRTWLIRHVGRWQRAGEKFLFEKENFQGSGDQENLKNSVKNSKSKDACSDFNNFLKKIDLSMFGIVPVRRSTLLDCEEDKVDGVSAEEAEMEGFVGAPGCDSIDEGEETHETEFRNSRLDDPGHTIDDGVEQSWNGSRALVVETACEDQVHSDDHGMVKVGKSMFAGVGGVEKRSVNSSIMCHHHAHEPSSAHLTGSFACGGSSGGLLGAPVWSVGRWSARLSSCWCCPGCGLYGDGTVCMKCDTDGAANSNASNSIPNLRVERRPEHRGKTKAVKASSGTQVGCPVVDNASGDAGLADYLRWAPRSWPIEAWECRPIHSN